MTTPTVIFQKAADDRRKADNARLCTWWISRTLSGSDPCVSIMCPVCEHPFSIKTPWNGHTIHADGTVTPSIQCPNKKRGGEPGGCGFHVLGKLADWQPLAEYPVSL